MSYGYIQQLKLQEKTAQQNKFTIAYLSLFIYPNNETRIIIKPQQMDISMSCNDLNLILIMSNSAIELVNGIFIVKTHFFEYSILNYLYQWTWIKDPMGLFMGGLFICLFVCVFVCSSHSRSFQSYGGVIVTIEGLHMLTYSHSQPLRYVTRQLFQTISVRLVNIKIINCSGSILAYLNNAMQTKQHATKTPHSYLDRNRICQGKCLTHLS